MTKSTQLEQISALEPLTLTLTSLFLFVFLLSSISLIKHLYILKKNFNIARNHTNLIEFNYISIYNLAKFVIKNSPSIQFYRVGILARDMIFERRVTTILDILLIRNLLLINVVY